MPNTLLQAKRNHSSITPLAFVVLDDNATFSFNTGRWNGKQ